MILSRIHSLMISVWFLFLIGVSISLQAHGEEFDLTATLGVVGGGPTIMPELKWNSFNPIVKVQLYRRQDNMVAYLEGTFKKENWKFFCNGIEVKNKQFKLPILLKGKETVVSIRLESPEGQTVREEYLVTFNDWTPEFAKNLRKSQELPVAGAGIYPSLGYTLISYKQTGVKDFSEVAITAKLSWNKPITNSWNAGINSFFTALPLSTNQDGISARFFGVNGRIGYTLPYFSHPWQVNLMGGFYYNTMFVSSSAFGYQNVMGPQMFPSIRRIFSSGNSILGYFKFSPMVSEFSLLGFGNREIAAGLSYSHLLKNRRFLSLSFDHSQLTLVGEKFSIQSSAEVFSVSYGL